MEGGGGGGGGSGGGAEARRVNIVYFLSRDGTVEHPHLIRAHHHRGGGVRLRDVKRWLSDLRGKEIRDSFAWSYKRRYRTGYVWQDLKDEDFIAPVSDDEYVLKGSHIPSSSSSSSSSIVPKFEVRQATRPGPSAETLRIEADDSGSPNHLPLDNGLPDPRPRGEESAEQRSAVFKIDLSSQRQEAQRREGEAVVAEESMNSSSRRSRGATCVFRSILTCRAAETNDSALLPIARRQRDRLATGGATGGAGGGPLVTHNQNSNSNNYRKSKSTGGGKSSRKAREKAIPAIYKPVAAPACSQCGKGFKPEKLHSHMKSCKPLKGPRTKEDSLKLQRQEFSKEAASSLLLAH